MYIRAGSRKNQPLKFYWSTFSNCTSTTCYNIYMNMKFRGCGFSTQDVYMHTWVVESPLFLTRGNADKSVRDWFPSVDVMVRLMFSRSTLSTKGSLNSVMVSWRKRREGKRENESSVVLKQDFLSRENLATTHICIHCYSIISCLLVRKSKCPGGCRTFVTKSQPSTTTTCNVFGDIIGNIWKKKKKRGRERLILSLVLTLLTHLLLHSALCQCR